MQAIFLLHIFFQNIKLDMDKFGSHGLCENKSYFTDRNLEEEMDRDFVDYIDTKRKERKLNHRDFANLVWPELEGDSAMLRWRRIRGKGSYEKAQKVTIDDMKALCAALGLDVAATTWLVGKKG